MALSEETAGHLHGAFEQMDLMLATRQVDAALGHLLQLLKHLQTVRADTRSPNAG